MSNLTPNPTLMGRTALIAHVHGAGFGSKRQATEVVDYVIGAIAAALRRGETVQLREFGAFQVKETAARQGRNIQTGELHTIPARRRVVFKPSKALLPQTETPA